MEHTIITGISSSQGVKNTPNLKTYGEQYYLNVDEFQTVEIKALNFSVRTINCLKRIQVTTVKDLLNCTPEDLYNIKGFGKTSAAEVVAFINSLTQIELQSTPKENILKRNPPSPSQRFMTAHRDQIFANDFSFFDDQVVDCSIKKEVQEQIYKFKEAYSILDNGLIEQCQKDPQTVIPLLAALVGFSEKQKKKEELYAILDSIPINRRNNTATYYIKAYTDDEEEQNTIAKFYLESAPQLGSLYLATDLVYNDYMLLKKFLKWCTFDLAVDAQSLWDTSCSKESTQEIIQLRSYGHTLEECGVKLCLTRERIRQIESKAIRKFEHNENQKRFIAKVLAEKKGGSVIYPEDIEKYTPNIRAFFYLLKNSNNGNYVYDKSLDVLIVGNSTVAEKISSFVDTLPDVFNLKKLDYYISYAVELGLPKDLVTKSITDIFNFTGNTYHRSRLSMKDVYKNILADKYPNGLHTGSPSEMQAFRNCIREKYGDINISENDHALAAAISRICVLCGRSRYKLKQKEYISKGLSDKIYHYIENSDSSIFLMNTLYDAFKEELKAEGVDNKYYLQGILHELYGDKFFFTRDYLSKDGEDTSLYSSIVDFIKNASFQVDKVQIQKHFPAVSDIVIQYAVSDPDIINCFGKYIHANKLKPSEKEKEYLRQKIETILSDGMQHHIKELYNIVTVERPEIFTRNGILYPFSAFSLVEHLFRDNYAFVRPFIAHSNVEISDTMEILQEKLKAHESYSVKDLSSFISENHLTVNSILDFIDSCNDEYLLIDADTLMSIPKIGVTETLVINMETLIEAEFAEEGIETVPIYRLTCLGSLPEIQVPWTDWLVYSLLKKWSKKFEVAASNSQFRFSIPLVAHKGKMNTTPWENAYKESDYKSKLSVLTETDIDDCLLDAYADSMLEGSLWD